MASGKRMDDAPRGGFRGYFVRFDELALLHARRGFETLALAVVDPMMEDEAYNRLEGKQRQQWLDLFEEVSTESSILGACKHLLFVGKKKDH